MSPQRAAARTTRRSIRKTALALAFALLASALILSPASAGGLAGVVKDAVTGAPLAGIDLDLFDVNFSPITTVSPVTGADGIYQITPLPAGQYYLRADPTAAQGYVDSYQPGVFLKSLATPVSVPEFGTTIASFDLDRGMTVSGTITDAATGLPMSGVDLDVFAADLSFIGSINTRTALDGSYTLGAFPADCFFVEASLDTTLYLPKFNSGHMLIGDATPLCVDGVNPVVGVDIALDLGGKISGALLDATSSAPADSIDIDVFDPLGNFLSYADGLSLADGSYMVGALPPGQYYVQADPLPARGYPDTYFGDVLSENNAILIAVTPGVITTGRDIHLVRAGTFSGFVTAAATGQPVAGLTVSVLDSTGSIMPGAGGSTAADGSFLIGAVPPGRYYVRAAGDPAAGLAYEFFPGASLASTATLLTAIAWSDHPGVDFALDAGGWISGAVTAQDTGLPIELVDIDVYSPVLEFIGALDATTAADGSYLVGPVPAGSYIVKAKAPATTPYAAQYYFHQADARLASTLAVTPPATAAGVDFTLAPNSVSDVEHWDSPRIPRLIGAYPNPFNPRTVVVFELPRRQEIRLSVHDVRGHQVAVLAQGEWGQGRHQVQWKGVDGGDRILPSGVYFARLYSEAGVAVSKMVLLK